MKKKKQQKARRPVRGPSIVVKVLVVLATLATMTTCTASFQGTTAFNARK